MTKNKKGYLVEAVQEALGTTKVDAEKAVDTMVEAVMKAMKAGDEVAVAREARNPKTGATVHVPATKVPKFRPAKSLKEMVK
ncbi:MAG: HU family DNA-binding protein [Parcubacteria group bacterium]|nr:HU family DNA-binding protein [Parcubacteria group bacterium]